MCALAARTAAAADPRIVTAVETRTPITLDGVARRRGVDSRGARDRLRSGRAARRAGRRPSARRCASLFDRDALYIGVVCHDATPSALIVNDIRKDFTPGEQDTLRGAARHVRGSPQRLRVRHQPGRGEVGHADRERRARRQHAAGTPCGRSRRRWMPTAGRRRCGFRSRRCASSAAKGASGASNFSRRIRRKNEVDYWSPVPRVYNLYRAGLAGTLDRPAATRARDTTCG